MQMRRFVYAILMLLAIGSYGCQLLEGSPDGVFGDERAISVSMYNPYPVDSQSVRVRFSAYKDVHQNKDVRPLFKIRWRPVNPLLPAGPNDAGERGVSGGVSDSVFDVVLDHLQGKMYYFVLDQFVNNRLVRSDSVIGAPAYRCTTDQNRPQERIRLYELGSTQGDGLVFSPNGVTRAVASQAAPYTVKIVFDAEHNTFIPAHTVPEYKASHVADTTVYLRISDHRPKDLDSNWDLRASIFSLIYGTWSDLEATFVASGSFSGSSIEYCDPSVQVARICAVRGPDGKAVVHGQAPDRYIELEISLGYHGVPYA